MGMSASQARFLCLTARKNNVEFHGQQINQQRTTLSNESAAYYSELCNMSVPTPPSVDDYTKVSYTFNDGAMNNTITSMIAKGNNKYSISYIQQWQDDYSIVASASSLIAKDGDKYKVGASELRLIEKKTQETEEAQWQELTPEEVSKMGYLYFQDGIYDMGHAQIVTLEDGKYMSNGEEIPEEEVVGYLYNETGNAQTSIALVKKEDNKYYKEVIKEDHSALVRIEDDYIKSLDEDAKRALAEEEQYYLAMLEEATGKSGDWFVRYVKNSTTGAYTPYFYNAADVTKEGNYANGYAKVDCYTLGSATKTKEVLNKEGIVEKDSSGRYISITIDGAEFSLTTNTITDEDAYNDAMNKYNYEQYQYDQKIQEINSKIEIVQQQDKSLELNLKQLDTEENAISTEMEAVKKVISKNIEKTFNTFEA